MGRFTPWLVAIALLAGGLLPAACANPPLPPPPTATPEPIVPTRTRQPATPTLPAARATARPQATQPATTTPKPAAEAAAQEAVVALDAAELARFGVAGPLEHVVAAEAAGLRFGSYLNWRANAEPPVPSTVDYWQMLRLSATGISPDWAEVERIIAMRPGSVWLVGNEPDVPWQDGITAARYAELYHEAYSYIKERDPQAIIGAGGVAMPSPLRLAYLDDVLGVYRERYGAPMPVDLWSVHAFTLREERDSWGVGIPPGMDVDIGQLYEIEDHGDLDIFRQHIRDFRAWLADNGYQDTPVAVTEFGILLPNDYGFPEEFVAEYLRESIEFMRTATGPTGQPADGGRLVQFWFWYSLHDDGAYPTGNLYDPAAAALTPLGEAYREYVLSLAD